MASANTLRYHPADFSRPSSPVFKHTIVESLKPLLLFVVLGGVGYGVYVALNQAPQTEPTSRVAPNWNKPAPAAGKTARSRNAAAAARPSPPATSKPQTSGLASGSSLPFGIGKSAGQPPAPPPLAQSPAAQPSSPPPLAQSEPTPQMATSSPTDRYAVSPTDRYAVAAAPETASPAPSDSAAAEAEQARSEFASTMRYAQSLLAAGKLVDALRELSKWYDHPALSSEEQSQLVQTLGQLAGTVIYSPDPWLGAPYVVQPGDTLESIADGCQVPWQLLAKINGVQNPTLLNPGEQLKVVRGPFYAQLNLQEQWLALFVDGLYAGRFAVQGGRETPKPEGTYPVAKFAADNPANAARRPYVSLGGDLHLCVPDDAGAPGVAAVRINERDMADVFDMLSERSQVTVRR